jgi:hypothetical protein
VPEGVAGLAQLPDLRPTANSGLSADLDAIATYLAVGVRAPISPIKGNGPLVKEGRALFAQAGCQHCHGGPNWTTSVLDATPPPAANDVVDAQLVRFLCRVGTFDADLFADGKGNEIRANALANGAGANVQARGALGLKCTVAALGVRERAVSAQRRGAYARRRARQRRASQRRQRRRGHAVGCERPARGGALRRLDRRRHRALPERPAAGGRVRADAVT